MLAVLAWGLWPGALLAAVVPFPDNSVSQESSIGLPPASEKKPDALDLADHAFDTRPLPSAKAKSRDEILDNIFQTEDAGTWLDQTRNSSQAKDVNALDLMRAYVNVVRNNAPSHSGMPTGSAGARRSDATGKGFVMSLAEGLDDPQTLSLMTKVIQPYVENDMVTFSLLGFGRFMLVGNADSGNLSVVNMANGRVMSLPSLSQSSALSPSGDTAYANAPNEKVPLFPNDTETFGKVLAFLIALITNPMTLISVFCVFAIFLLVKAAKRLS